MRTTWILHWNRSGSGLAVSAAIPYEEVSLTGNWAGIMQVQNVRHMR